jgi:hypothetical protein
MPSRHAIVTLCIGDQAKEYAAISHPTMMAYAARIGADFYVMSERQWPDRHIFFEKFQMYPIVLKYERTLYLDGDVIVSPKAPDIFAAVPSGQLGFLNEYDHVPQRRERYRSIIEGIMKHADRKLDGWVWPKTYFNAGIFVTEPRFAWYMKDKPKDKMRRIFLYDQGFANLMIHEHELPVFRLPLAFNYMPRLLGHPVMQYISTAYFIHVTAMHRLRMKIMRDVVESLGMTKE